MDKRNGLLNVYSADLSYYDLQSALSENNGTIIFDVCDNETTRSFSEVEWITFALMALPAAESAYNLVMIIKNEIKARVLKQMRDTSIRTSVKISINISLPFFSYEKSEEIIVNPDVDD